MKNTTKNWFRAALGIRLVCEATLEDNTWCRNMAVYGVGMYGGPHIVVCNEHYLKAKELLEEGHGTQ